MTPMTRPLGILSLLLGTFWAQGLLVAGFILIFSTPLTLSRLLPAVALLAAGAFVAMVLVIDRLVTGASPGLVLFLKLSAAGTFWLAGGLTVYTLFTGQLPDLPMSL